MTRAHSFFSALFAVAGAVGSVVSAPSCASDCRDLTGVNSSCAPPCVTKADCEDGNVCVADPDDFSDTGKICAIPCTMGSNDCSCICDESGAQGFCGSPEPNDLPTCRADGNSTRWASYLCSCQHTTDHDRSGYEECVKMYADEPTVHPSCVELDDDYLFCAATHVPKGLPQGRECEVPENECTAELERVLACEAATD